MLWPTGANDEISASFHSSLFAMTWIGRIGVFVLPFLAYIVTYRPCPALQRDDAALVSHGVESGVIKRLPHGEFVEAHVRLDEDREAHSRGRRRSP
ncbi:hypothetical protein ACFQ0B_43845 [Nonomuraea thailandensis]